MPIYAYHCPSCAADFELLRSMSDTSAPVCPECGGEDATQRVSKPAAFGKSAQRLKEGRAAAAREGHFSNYSAAERKNAGV
ncbi:MAG: FmdB family zinc ribbon protein [Mangrovicoccus sp.]